MPIEIIILSCLVCAVVGVVVGAKSKTAQKLLNSGVSAVESEAEDLETDVVAAWNRQAAAVASLVQKSEAAKARLAKNLESIKSGGIQKIVIDGQNAKAVATASEIKVVKAANDAGAQVQGEIAHGETEAAAGIKPEVEEKA